MKIHKCPRCGNMSFYVTAHVTQTWKVDEEGDFIEEVSSCDEVTHRPDDDDIWSCANPDCNWSGAGSEAVVDSENTDIKEEPVTQPGSIAQKVVEAEMYVQGKLVIFSVFGNNIKIVMPDENGYPVLDFDNGYMEILKNGNIAPFTPYNGFSPVDVANDIAERVIRGEKGDKNERCSLNQIHYADPAFQKVAEYMNSEDNLFMEIAGRKIPRRIIYSTPVVQCYTLIAATDTVLYYLAENGEDLLMVRAGNGAVVTENTAIAQGAFYADQEDNKLIYQAEDSQDSDDIKTVLKSIDRNTVRANCVTKDDICQFLMKHGMEDCLEEVNSISEEDIENGFYIVHADASDAPYMALEIQRIDAIADLGINGIPATDEEAGLRALQIGVPLINDVPGVDKNRFVDTPKNRKDVEDFYRRPFRVSFSLPGSIVINALSKEEAKKAVEAAISGNGSEIAEDITLVLQDHLQHRDVSVDEVEEE